MVRHLLAFRLPPAGPSLNRGSELRPVGLFCLTYELRMVFIFLKYLEGKGVGERGGLENPHSLKYLLSGLSHSLQSPAIGNGEATSWKESE